MWSVQVWAQSVGPYCYLAVTGVLVCPRLSRVQRKGWVGLAREQCSRGWMSLVGLDERRRRGVCMGTAATGAAGEFLSSALYVLLRCRSLRGRMHGGRGTCCLPPPRQRAQQHPHPHTHPLCTLSVNQHTVPSVRQCVLGVRMCVCLCVSLSSVDLHSQCRPERAPLTSLWLSL